MASGRHPNPMPRRALALALSLGLALSALLWCSATWAQAPGAAEPGRMARERDRIRIEHERLDAQFAAEQARCIQRFAVTACVDDVRQRRRAALAVPQAQALALDDVERRERAAARRQAVLDKQRRAAELPAQDPTAAASAARSSGTDGRHSGPAPLARGSPAPRRPSAGASAAAAQRAAGGRQRQLEMKAGQARIQAREAARARGSKAAAPLDGPAASAPVAR